MHFWAFIGSLLLASGVAMGAYGAHGLRAIVDVPVSYTHLTLPTSDLV